MADVSDILIVSDDISGLIVPNQPPSFIAGAISSTIVDIVFAVPVTIDSALTDPSNYTVVGGPGGVSVAVTTVTSVGGTAQRVSLTLGAPLQSMETYAAKVSSSVTSIYGIPFSSNAYSFNWADMSLPTQGVPLAISISSFSGEVSTGLLGNPAGQVFFSPAYEVVGAASTIEIESVSTCTRAFDQYVFPSLPDPPALYTFGSGVSSVLGTGFILWAPAEKLGLFKIQLSNFGQEDVLPRIYDFSTGSLESQIGDTPAIATLRETIDITKASFLRDTRWRTFPGTGASVFMTADNMAPIGPGPTLIHRLSQPRAEVRSPYDVISLLDTVYAAITWFEDDISLTDSVSIRTNLFFSVTALETLSVLDDVIIEAGLNPGSLYSALQTIFGALFTGLWVGEDIVVDGLNNVTSWPEHVGVDTLTNSHATNRFTTRIVNGRQWMYTASETGKSLESSISMGTVYMAMVSLPTLPFTNYKTALGADINQVLTGQVSTSALYPYQSSNRYVDGILTNNVSSGIHLLEASTGASAYPFFIGGLEASFPDYPGRDWTADIGCVVTLSGDPTSQQRADALALLNTYYNV